MKKQVHESLVFIMLYFINNIIASPCNVDVKMQQMLINEGFHRYYAYDI